MKTKILLAAILLALAGCNKTPQTQSPVVDATSAAPTVQYKALLVSDSGVEDIFTLRTPDVSKGESGGNELNYQSRAGVMNVMESVVDDPETTGYIAVEKAYRFGDKYLLVVSTGEYGNACPATTYAFTFDPTTESVTGKTTVDGCSETVEALAEGNKLTVKKDGNASIFYNGEVISTATKPK